MAQASATLVGKVAGVDGINRIFLGRHSCQVQQFLEIMNAAHIGTAIFLDNPLAPEGTAPAEWFAD